jgi:hypothetical protein
LWDFSKDMALEDHIKRGKKLLPPLLANGMKVHSSLWQIERFPQLFLLALYLEDNSLADTINIFLQMNVSYASILKDFRCDKIFRPIRMGEHMTLNEHEKQAIRNRSEGAVWRANINPYLIRISSLFMTNPMDYLLNTDTVANSCNRDDNIRMLKIILIKTVDSHSKTSLFIQGAELAVELRSGNTKICKGVDIPDLNAIVDYPNTKESQHLAGFIVASSSMTTSGMDDSQTDMVWQRQFWDSCYRLEPCKFDYE